MASSRHALLVRYTSPLAHRRWHTRISTLFTQHGERIHTRFYLPYYSVSTSAAHPSLATRLRHRPLDSGCHTLLNSYLLSPSLETFPNTDGPFPGIESLDSLGFLFWHSPLSASAVAVVVSRPVDQSTRAHKQQIYRRRASKRLGQRVRGDSVQLEPNQSHSSLRPPGNNGFLFVRGTPVQ